MRPVVRQLPDTGPRVTGAVRRPISCWRAGSIVTVARPSTIFAGPAPVISSSYTGT